MKRRRTLRTKGVMDDTEKEIQQLREQLKPLEVDRRNSPSWLRKAVKDAIKRGDLKASEYPILSADDALNHAASCCGNKWLDHRGRLKTEKDILVSEPYDTLTPTAISQLEKFCKALRTNYSIAAVSWHYPGRTIQILIGKP